MQNANSILMRIRNEMSVPVKRSWTTETLNRYLEVLSKLERPIEAFTVEERKLEADRHWSDDAKKAKLIAAGTHCITSLGWMASVLDALDNSIAEYKRTYFSVPQARAMPSWHFFRKKRCGIIWPASMSHKKAWGTCSPVNAMTR
jgi:hypothetical protein